MAKRRARPSLQYRYEHYDPCMHLESTVTTAPGPVVAHAKGPPDASNGKGLGNGSC